MAQRNKIQDGTVVFSTTDPDAFDLGFNILGNASISKALVVSQAYSADGTISTNTGTNLVLTVQDGASANIILKNPVEGGSVLLNGIAFPADMTTPNVGGFIGASNVNTLQFYPFVVANVVSDTLSVSYLNTTYPDITPGQMVIGSTVVYLNVGAGVWRFMSNGSGGGGGGGGTPGGVDTYVQYNASGTFDGSAAFTWDNSTAVLTLGTSGNPATVIGNVDEDLTIIGGTSLILSSDTGNVVSENPVVVEGSISTITAESTHDLVITGGTGVEITSLTGNVDFTVPANFAEQILLDGDPGAFGQILVSNGSGSPNSWIDAPSGGGGGGTPPAIQYIVSSAGQTVFTTTIGTSTGHMLVSVNGVIQVESISYTVTGANQITFATGQSLSDDVLIYYFASGGSAAPAIQHLVSTTGQTVFTTTVSTTAISGTTGHMLVSVNGVIQVETVSYTVTGANQITFAIGQLLGDDVIVHYFP